jgi:hypothetical protein
MEKCLSPKATSYVVKNMMPGKFYTFKVVAKNGGDKSDSSCRWEVTMLKASASGKKGGTATVTWTGNAGTYILSVMGSGGKVISTKAIPANATSVSFSGLKSGKYSAVMALPASAIPSNALPGETAVTLPFAIPSN